MSRTALAASECLGARTRPGSPSRDARRLCRPGPALRARDGVPHGRGRGEASGGGSELQEVRKSLRVVGARDRAPAPPRATDSAYARTRSSSSCEAASNAPAARRHRARPRGSHEHMVPCVSRLCSVNTRNGGLDTLGIASLPPIRGEARSRALSRCSSRASLRR
jgi:hypothetical protein